MKVTPNRVGTGVEPVPPAPPGMRVRTGRFTTAEHATNLGVSLRLHPQVADTD